MQDLYFKNVDKNSAKKKKKRMWIKRGSKKKKKKTIELVQDWSLSQLSLLLPEIKVQKSQQKNIIFYYQLKNIMPDVKFCMVLAYYL